MICGFMVMVVMILFAINVYSAAPYSTNGQRSAPNKVYKARVSQGCGQFRSVFAFSFHG